MTRVVVRNTEPLLRVEHLRVEVPMRRGVLVAVDDVSFDIAPGEVLGVVGESGAGDFARRDGPETRSIRRRRVRWAMALAPKTRLDQRLGAAHSASGGRAAKDPGATVMCALQLSREDVGRNKRRGK